MYNVLVFPLTSEKGTTNLKYSGPVPTSGPQPGWVRKHALPTRRGRPWRGGCVELAGLHFPAGVTAPATPSPRARARAGAPAARLPLSHPGRPELVGSRGRAPTGQRRRPGASKPRAGGIEVRCEETAGKSQGQFILRSHFRIKQPFVKTGSMIVSNETLFAPREQKVFLWVLPSALSGAGLPQRAAARSHSRTAKVCAAAFLPAGSPFRRPTRCNPRGGWYGPGPLGLPSRPGPSGTRPPVQTRNWRPLPAAPRGRARDTPRPTGSRAVARGGHRGARGRRARETPGRRRVRRAGGVARGRGRSVRLGPAVGRRGFRRGRGTVQQARGRAVPSTRPQGGSALGGVRCACARAGGRRLVWG